MKNIYIGDNYEIQCYKHNSKIHRCWSEAVILDIKKDYIVCGNNKALVIESDGRTRKTREPAVMYFFKNKWFNVIAQLKKEGISYYCNIASPYIIEDNTIKYIDYDLDLRVFPDGGYKILDYNEYKYHKKKMKYPEEIDIIINKELQKLIEMKKNNEGPFDKKQILEYKKIYEALNK